MKYLRSFENFLSYKISSGKKISKINESEVLYDKTLFDEIMDYLENLDIYDEIEEAERSDDHYFNPELDINLSQRIQDENKKEFRFKLINVIYNKQNIIKGALILNELRKETNMQKIQNIINSDVNIKDLNNLYLSVWIVPFYKYENTVFRDSFNKMKNDFQDKKVRGVFSSKIFDVNDLGVIYEDESSVIQNWRKLAKDDILYKFIVSACLGFYSFFKMRGENEFEFELKKTIIHEITHLTQFINSLLLNIFEAFKKNKNDDVDVILGKTLVKSIKISGIKVGLPRKSFKGNKTYDATDTTRSHSDYLNTSVEIKTKIGDAVRNSFWKWKKENSQEWENLKANKQPQKINDLIKKLSSIALDTKEVKMIKNNKFKAQEISNFLNKIIKDNL
jgi:hypothetical protein